MRTTIILVASLFTAGLLLLPSAAAAPEDAFAGEPEPTRQLLAAVADAIDGQNVYDCIWEITHDVPYSYRLMGTPTKDMFLDKYGDVFTEMGLESKIVYFDAGKRAWDVSENPAGANLMGVYPGKDPTKWVVIGSHYDTQIGTQGGGAHDNASGICTVKEVARVIAELKPVTEASFVFAWWDGEEWGLFGSQAFVQDHNETKELLNVSYETEVTMLQGIAVDMAGLVYPANNPWAEGAPGGVPAKQHFHLRAPPVTVEDSWASFGYGSYEKLKERDDFPQILEDFQNYRDVVEEVWRVWLEVPEEHVSFEEDSYGRSDHVPFMAAGVPALRVQGAHDNEYPCYHHPCDTLEFMAAAAGGEDLLIAGMDLETTTTALISTFMAAKGVIAPIGSNVTDASQGGEPQDVDDPGIPTGGLVAVIVGTLAATLMLRRRH